MISEILTVAQYGGGILVVSVGITRAPLFGVRINAFDSDKLPHEPSLKKSRCLFTIEARKLEYDRPLIPKQFESEGKPT